MPPRINLDGVTVYRRRAHLVVWDSRMAVTVPDWPLYWLPRGGGRTFACVSRAGSEGLWLPVVDLIGHWDWFAGDIVGARVLSGYGPDGRFGPLTEQIRPYPRLDPDTGARYWYSDRSRLWAAPPDPLAHL